MMDAMGQPRPRRRRPPTRGLLFGASLDRVPSTSVAGAAATGAVAPRHPEPVPIALIGASNPVAPPRVASFGAMAATWPLVDRAVDLGSRTSAAPTSAAPTGVAPTGAAPTEWASFAASVVLPDRRRHAGGPIDGVERRWGGLSALEWQRLLGR